MLKVEVKRRRRGKKREEGEAIKWFLRKFGAALALEWIGF